MTTVGKHRWGAGQSSSDAFVRDFVENNQQVLDPSYFSLKRLFVGVCHAAESEGRVLDLGGLVPSACVLRRLLEEFFALVSSELGTREFVRGLMASPEGSWSLVRSEDLPKGLSDGDDGSRSSEETPLKYQIPEDVVLRIPESDEVACSSRYGDVAFYEADFNASIRFPMQPLMRELLDRLNLAPGQLAPNTWRTVVGSMVMWKVLSDGKDDITLDELLFCYKPSQIPASPGFWTLNMRQRGLKLIVGNPSSNREWKDNYVFVCGDNWEGLQCEKDDNFHPPLKRPKLDSDGHNRVLRALHHKEHHFKHFIRPELLALYSFGPEPRMATAKLNREKLRKMMSQQDEAPLTLGKKRKTESSSKKLSDERILPPPPPPQKPSCARARNNAVRGGLNRIHGDRQPLSSMGGGLDEAQDRDRVVGEMASLKVEMAVKEDELKKEMAERKTSDERLEGLTLQMEAVKVSAVEEFKSSEAYDDNNTKYFLAGFSLLKRQAKEKYPDLDFEAFQPFEDDESVMPVEGVDGGTTPVDPQLDDDAAS
uniref:Uncharacterized protein n=1 Tax=Fagus sylvatica TaxID=28930 RepID=A0A2N9G9C7_FAGSY